MRPKATPKIEMGVRFPVGLHRRLQATAERKHLSMNRLIVELLTDALPASESATATDE